MKQKEAILKDSPPSGQEMGCVTGLGGWWESIYPLDMLNQFDRVKTQGVGK